MTMRTERRIILLDDLDLSATEYELGEVKRFMRYKAHLSPSDFVRLAQKLRPEKEVTNSSDEVGLMVMHIARSKDRAN